jgi:nitrilase
MATQVQSVRAAVVRAAPVAFDRERTLEKVRTLTAGAAYPRGLTFGAAVGNRIPEGREQYRCYWESAVDVPGPAVDVLADIARHHQVYLVIGVIERDGGTLSCRVLFFSADGRYLGKHRKLMPTAYEKLIWGFGDGSTLPVFETPLGRLGAVICWQDYMPLLPMTMYAKGIQLSCAPTADGRDSWIATMQHIALEGRCFVLSCHQFARRRDYPQDYHTSFGDDPETILSRGGSCIVNPLGQILAGPNYSEECLLTAELDLADIARGKYDFDVVGHYARPDIFSLHVNEHPRSPVIHN